MKYILSCDSSQYQLWQAEILVRSFYNHNLQDDLIIAVADKLNFDRYGDFCFKHPHKLRHKSVEKINPFLNKPYAALIALESGIEHFTLIEPDMILVNPLLPAKGIHVGVDAAFTEEEFILQGFGPVINEIKTSLEKRGIVYRWPFMGGVMQFNGLEKAFVKNVILLGQKYTTAYKEQRLAARAAWLRCFFEYTGIYDLAFHNEYEGNLLSYDLNCNFIHYHHGLPPVFSKKMFDPILNLSGKTPYEKLLEHNPTPATNYLHEILRQMVNTSNGNQ